MKEIGIKLKTKREESGLSVEEVGEDLQVKTSDVINLESGDRDAFTDIVELKNLISEYAKYLGFDNEELLDEFNEYLFEQTSKISLDDIEKAREKKLEDEKEKIASPYTIIKKEKNKKPIIIGLIIVVLVIAFLVSYFLVTNYVKNNENKQSDVSYTIGG